MKRSFSFFKLIEKLLKKQKNPAIVRLEYSGNSIYCNKQRFTHTSERLITSYCATRENPQTILNKRMRLQIVTKPTIPFFMINLLLKLE